MAIDGVQIRARAGFNDVCAGALPRDQVAGAEVDFYGHFTQRVLALRHRAQSIIHQFSCGFRDAVNCFQRGIHRTIANARIATYGERAVDVFYVKDLFGLKITSSTRLDTIRHRLLDAIVEPDSEAVEDEDSAATA